MERGITAVHSHARRLGLKWLGPAPQVPSANRPIDELLVDLERDYERKRAHHKSKRDGLLVTIDEPVYGVLFVGDPHLGDPGCDIGLLAHHLSLVRNTPGLYAVNMGDLTNNWVGKLKFLYAHQHTTDDEEEALARWLIREVPWLAVVLGNHDKWSPVAQILCKEAGVLYVSHGAKFIVKNPVGTLKMDIRHTHRGNSQYNPSFGQAKQSFRGSDCDIIIGAHTHSSAYTLLRNGVTGKVSHAVRVGAYKRWDDYADQSGFDADSIGPAWLAVCDPSRGDEGKVQGFWDIEQGVEYLSWLRGKK